MPGREKDAATSCHPVSSKTLAFTQACYLIPDRHPRHANERPKPWKVELDATKKPRFNPRAQVFAVEKLVWSIPKACTNSTRERVIVSEQEFRGRIAQKNWQRSHTTRSCSASCLQIQITLTHTNHDEFLWKKEVGKCFYSVSDIVTGAVGSTSDYCSFTRTSGEPRKKVSFCIAILKFP